MVRADAPLRGWANAPVPILVVEVLSRSTRRRDLGTKHDFYRRIGVTEYWVVDRENAVVIRFRDGMEGRLSTTFEWSPAGTEKVLDVDVAGMFAEIRSRLA